MTNIGQLEKPFTLMVADRNPHIRNFLKRELTSTGYRVRMAETIDDILKWAHRSPPLHLLIMDLDPPDTGALELVKKMSNRIPVLPVVLHSYYSEEVQAMMQLENVFFVEKGENSIERLKFLIARILPSYAEL